MMGVKPAPKQMVNYIIKDRNEAGDQTMELQEDGTIAPHSESSPAVFESVFVAQMECNKLSVAEPNYDWFVARLDEEISGPPKE